MRKVRKRLILLRARVVFSALHRVDIGVINEDAYIVEVGVGGVDLEREIELLKLGCGRRSIADSFPLLYAYLLQFLSGQVPVFPSLRVFCFFSGQNETRACGIGPASDSYFHPLCW